MRIVIVEDEIKIREGMGKLIASMDEHIIVGEAADGELGLDLVLRFKPDLVITDIRMPKLDGLEMLKALYERKVSVHAVILSGYSEFEYAKKAIQYGVDDYLLKPLAVEDVQGMLEKVSERIMQEEQMTYGTPENQLRNLLVGHVQECEEEYQKVKKVCGFQGDMNYELMVGYIGIAPTGYRLEVENAVEELKRTYSRKKIYLLYLENEQIFYCLAGQGRAGDRIKEDFETSFYRKMLWKYKDEEERPVWAKDEFENLNQLKTIGKKLSTYLADALMVSEPIWITKEVLHKWREDYHYPADINNRIKNAICQSDNGKIQNAAEQFLKYMENHRFAATDVRQAFSKSYFLILDTLQDIDKFLYEHLQNTNTRQLIAQAFTWIELKTAYLDAIHILTGPKAKREDISNYVIKKAIQYIREHYQEGITLEEVSRTLDITPEYLSTLFNREMKINFSAFLKQFRISHAKRLLKGTDKKVYEIADAVGYSDAKYFARVFKEEQGISPGEYRQMN